MNSVDKLTPVRIERDMPTGKRIFGISRNNKGLPCPFEPILCQEGYCHACQIYPNWQRKGEMINICSCCGKETHRKPGLNRPVISHEICPECMQKHFPEAL